MFVWREIKKKRKEEEEEHQETRLPSTSRLQPGFLLSLSCDSVKIEESGQTCSPSANMQLAATFSHLGAPDASVEPR